MELSDEFGRVPDPLDGGSIGQHGTRQPGARTAKAAWSTPGLAGDLESLFAENLEQLSKGGGWESGGTEFAAGEDVGLDPLETEAAPVQFPGGFPLPKLVGRVGYGS